MKKLFIILLIPFAAKAQQASDPISLVTINGGLYLKNYNTGAKVKMSTDSAALSQSLDSKAGINHTHTYPYAINVQALTSSPVDAQTIYFGMLPKAPITTANVSKVYFRATGTITAAEIYCYSGTAGTAESWSIYIRKNNTTDYLIATVAAATNERVFSNTSLSIPVISGDYIEIKSVNPTWATNPLMCILSGYIKIN